jgi:anaerobic magnesium-protoporphyrin IX monomethyl ester cyclase
LWLEYNKTQEFVPNLVTKEKFMSKILFINPDWHTVCYSNARLKAGISTGYTPMSLCSLAAYARDKGHQVAILDLNLLGNSEDLINEKLHEFQPDAVGLTAATPSIMEAGRVAVTVRKLMPSVRIIVGGPHPTAMPEKTLEMGCFDALCAGEGEHLLCKWLDGDRDVPGLWRFEDGTITPPTEPNPGIADIDTLPFPAFDLLDIERYNFADVNCRRNPVALMESSRGCFANCIYCNKLIHGYRMRFKSVERVVEEIEYCLKMGFREIAFMDDCISADMTRFMEICEEIKRRGLDFAWTPQSGVRVDRVSPELLKLAREAGCYRVPFGVETGSERILKIVGKGTTLDQARKAVADAKAAGLEAFTFFMLGLPGETEEDLQKTVDFAIELNPHFAKFPFTTPMPGTRLFNNLDAEGRIKTYDWEKYFFTMPTKEIYDHPTLSWEILEKYEKRAYRRFYFRPSYAAMMVGHSLRSGMFWKNVKTFMKTAW